MIEPHIFYGIYPLLLKGDLGPSLLLPESRR